MRNRYSRLVSTVLFAVGFAWVYGPAPLSPAGAADAESLPGMATVTGTVQAPKAFKAAQVHFMNAEKNVLFMVYTSGGRYRAVNLFPGTYEVTVRATGLDGTPQKLTLAAGARETLDITLREGTPQAIRDRKSVV